MVTMQVVYEAGLRTHVEHEPSGATLITDAPVDNHGQGRSFSPTDLLATALASCILTTIGIVAERNGIDVRGMNATVTKEMTQTPPRRVARLGVTVRLPESLAADQRKRLESVAHSCPVHQSLHPDVKVDLQFVYRAAE